MVVLRQEGSDMSLVQAQQLEITEISNMARRQPPLNSYLR
jgi:hypothetical protein